MSKSADDLYRVAEYLERHHAEGDRLALLRAIYFCMRAEVAPPLWARNLFCAAFLKVADAEARSWDDVFGQPYPGVRLDALQRLRSRHAVWDRIRTLRREHTPGDLHDIVADERKLSRTVIVNLEKAAQDEYLELVSKAATLEPRGWKQLPLPLPLPN